MGQSGIWVDHTAHLLHFGGHHYPCDRDIEALALWRGHALLLSSDTDCLSLWDSEGLIRTTRVGVYPQDMAISGDRAYVCGGADGAVHLVELPCLEESASYSVPGMTERICARGNAAHLLTLMAEPEVHTRLLRLDLDTGSHQEAARFAGIPGALTADESGLWVGVSELVLHLPWGAGQPDMTIEGISLARQIEVQATGVLITDGLEDRSILIRT